jgi:hypothetical protein
MLLVVDITALVLSVVFPQLLACATGPCIDGDLRCVGRGRSSKCVCVCVCGDQART